MSGVIVRARFRPRAPADGAVVELRVCGGSGVRADFEGQQWWPLIIPGGLPVLKARLGWDGQRFDGGAVTTVGQMRIADSDGRLEPYKGLIWKGATAEIWTAPLKQRNGVELTADGDFTLLWQGLADDIKVEGQICTIVLADAGEKLRVPVLDQEYDGAGDLGGIAERKGGKIGRGWGRCPSVKGRLIDSAYWIYDFGITPDGAATIHAVRDGGYGLAVQTTAASLAALRALALDDGKVATCVVANRVLVRWWTRPKFLPSADITFGATTRPAEIAASVLAARAPSVAFGAGQVAAYNAVQAASCGRYVDPDADASLTVEGLLDWLFNGLGSWWQLSAAGTLEIGRYGEGGVSYTVDETRVIDVDRQGIIMPVARRSLGYQPNAAIHGDSDIAASITAGDVQGLGWLATSSATGTLLLNAAYTAVAATAVTGNSGEAVLCATDAAGDQVPGTDFAYSWAGRARRVARHPGHDDASPTIFTQLASKKGFIVHHLGGNGGAFLAPAGVLVRNRLLQSESLSVSPWSASGVSVSINAGVDHYGVQGLDRIIEDTSTGWHFIDQAYTPGSDPTGLSWTLSAVVQAGGRSKIQLCFPAAGGVFAMETVCNFDLATGTRISNTANVTGYGIVQLGGGLYRIWMTAPATGNAPIVGRIFLLDGAGNRSYTGDGSALLYAGHVQVEQASTFTAYQCTTTGPAQRTAFCYKVGAQWYYDRGDGTQVAFVPDSNCIALGWLATSSDDTISGGGLLSPVTLTEAAFPAADVTAENTAADTAAVGGRVSATIAATIAASGRLVSGAKVPQAIVAGAGTVLTASPLSASQSSGVATINVAAHTRYYDFGAVSYNAGAITGLSTSTVYYIYADDPDYAGGAVTYVATTSLTAAIATGRIYFGKLVTPSTGSGGTTVPPPEYCVDIAMWLGGALRAGDARRGDDLWCMDDGGRFIGRRAIESLEYAVADCVELRAGHARVVVSDTTPLWTTTRGLIRAGVARPGDRVAVRLSGIDAVLALDCVSRVGARPVALIRVGDHSYAAGVEPDAMIYTHNGAQKP